MARIPPQHTMMIISTIMTSHLSSTSNIHTYTSKALKKCQAHPLCQSIPPPKCWGWSSLHYSNLQYINNISYVKGGIFTQGSLCVDLAKHILTPQQFIVNARENKPLLNTYILPSPCVTQLNKKRIKT